MVTNQDDLTRLRNQVDEINLQILELLNRRAHVVQQIGEKKRQDGRTHAFDPKREEEIFAYLYKNNTGPFDNDMIQRIFKRIFDESTNLQELIIKT